MRRLATFAFALATLATAACGGGDDSTTGPTPTPTPSGNATVTVVNHAPTGSVMFLRYRACGAGSWGADQLGSGILWQNEEVSFQVSAGCIDVRATPSESGLDYLYFNGVQLAAGEARTLEITAFPAAQ